MHDRQTKRRRGGCKRIYKVLREYVPQHCEKGVSSCTCNRQKVNLKVLAEIEDTIYQYTTAMFTIVDMPAVLS